MDVQAARRVSVFERIGNGDTVHQRLQYPTKPRVFHRIGFQSAQICKFWLQGRCSRNPCRFLHSDCNSSPNPCVQTSQKSRPKLEETVPKTLGRLKNGTVESLKKKESEEPETNSETPKILETIKKEQPDTNPPQRKSKILEAIREEEPDTKPPHRKRKRECDDADDDDTTQAKRMRPNPPQDPSNSPQVTLLKVLEGHSKTITGVALPCGYDKFYTGSIDGTLCIWDINSGARVLSVKLGTEIRCMITQGPWIFVAVDNGIKACDTRTCTEHPLDVDGGNVCSMAADGVGYLFGGLQDGSILVWKGGTSAAVATLKGHQLPVVSLCCRAGRLYSASEDQTIRVWDINTFECLQVLKGHSAAVTSVLCWETFMLSGSLDKTLKVWGPNEDGTLKVVHEFGEESGIVALSAIRDAMANTTLLCSLTDCTLRLYKLPSFSESCRISSEGAIQILANGYSDLFFTGDTIGHLGVWRLHGQQ